MKRQLMPAMVVVVVLTALSRTPDSGAHSDSSSVASVTHYRVYDAGGPVYAFAVQADVIWCAIESTVVSIPMHGGERTVYPMLGSMPAQAIKAIVADKRGRVWFGGPHGAAMKNGLQFGDFTVNNGLSNDRVYAIVAADDGSVWVGTDSGANVLTGETWKQFTVKDGLLSNKIQAITLDDKGNVWLGTDKGINAFNGKIWRSYTAQDGMSENDDTKALAYDRIKGVLWAAVGDQDVNTFDGQKWNVYMDIQTGTLTIMADSQNRIWFGTAKGILKFNGDDWLPDPTPFGVPINQAYQMLNDEKGDLWFATGRGIIRLLNPYAF
jgi:ligand-binding sensor domain-containing protein